jgi:small-conductance mechanosensitive channel
MTRHLTRRAADEYARHFVRRAVHVLAFLVALIAVRTSRTAVNELTRRISERLREVGIPIASSTMDSTITSGSDRTSRESSRSE